MYIVKCYHHYSQINYTFQTKEDAERFAETYAKNHNVERKDIIVQEM